MNELLINGVQYAWGDVEIYLFGQPVRGILGVDYKSKKNKTALYAAGRDAHSMQHGRRENDGTLTVLQSEVIALNLSARAKGYRDLLDVDFDIMVKFANERGVMTIDKICTASITELPTSIKEGDANMSVALPFLCLRIQYDIAA